MISVNGIVVEYLGHTIPVIRIVSRGGASFYKTLTWPVGKPLNAGTIKVEVAKQWKVDPGQVVILDSVEVPKINGR
jgi:hypothetical protein